DQPLPTGRRVGIITNAGGPGILCADACEAGGLAIPELSAATKSQLAGYLPATASVANPVDLIASATPEHYRQSIATLLTSAELDALIVIYIPAGLAETKAVEVAVKKGVAGARNAGAAGKPVLVCRMTQQGERSPLTLDKERVPSYAFPETAAR